MSKNESRSNQNKEQKINKKQTGNIFYWIIGALTIVLLLLIIFVFVRSGKKQEIVEEEPESALVEEKNTDTESNNQNTNTAETKDNDQDEESNDENDIEDTDHEEDNETEEEEEDDDSIQPGESEIVDENSPHDSSHVVNYNEGSADRIAIKNKVMTATGLDSNLIEWWVGNDGPGKVETTVSDSEKQKIYKVYLQYGDGEWNVTSYERLDKLP